MARVNVTSPIQEVVIPHQAPSNHFGRRPAAKGLGSKENPTRTKYPSKEIYEQGELGRSEIENRKHSAAAQCFKRGLSDSRAEGSNDTAKDEWREIMMPFLEGIFTDTMVAVAGLYDEGLGLDDNCEFSDTATPDHGEVVHYAKWDVSRDLPPPVEIIQAKQTIALAANVLGSDYAVLCAVVDRGWSVRQVGETEGYVDRAQQSVAARV